jgi:hypothetical protein
MSIALFFKLEHHIFRNLILKTNFKIKQIFLMETPLMKLKELDKTILEFNKEFLIFIKKNKSAFKIYNCSIDVQLAHLKFIMHFFDYKCKLIDELIGFKNKIVETKSASIRRIDTIIRELLDSHLLKSELNIGLVLEV